MHINNEATSDVNLPRQIPSDEPKNARSTRQQIIAVGGGKGGIGKSLIAANIGVHLARQNRQVVLIDADLGGANLHTCLGIKAPKTTLSDFINRRVKSLKTIIAPTHVANLGLISGALDLLGAANPKYTQKLRILREIAKLDMDHVIIDLGGGTGFNILDFFLIADIGILTVIPEPTSVENAYRFIKAAYYRKLKLAELAWDSRPLVEEAIKKRGPAGLHTPSDLVTYIEKQNPKIGNYLRQELTKFPFQLVINQVRSEKEQHLGKAICNACYKYFGISMRFVGHIPYDDAVWQSIRHRIPLLLDSPNSPASKSIAEITTRLITLE